MNKTTLGNIITHDDLVEVARKWLCRKSGVVITEMAGLSEIPDAIGWHGGHSTVIECKVSVSDFRAERHKGYRTSGGIGQQRYYLTPKGLLAGEVLGSYGLLEWDGKRIYETSKPTPRSDYYYLGEMNLLVSALKRIGRTSPKGVSVKYYTIGTKNRTTLGVRQEQPS